MNRVTYPFREVCVTNHALLTRVLIHHYLLQIIIVDERFLLREMPENIFDCDETVVVLVEGEECLSNRFPLIRELFFQDLFQLLQALLQDSLGLGVFVFIKANFEYLLVLLCLPLFFRLFALVDKEEFREEQLLKLVEAELSLREERLLLKEFSDVILHKNFRIKHSCNHNR